MSEQEAANLPKAGKRRKTNILAASGLVCAALLLAAFTYICLPILPLALVLGRPPHYPTGQEMISGYLNNKADFERLARVILEGEETSWLGGNECRLQDGRHIRLAENENCRQIAEICRRLEIKRALAGPDGFSLYIASWGGAMGGSAIGYEYSPVPDPWGLVADVDNPGEEWSGRSRHQHIEGNWYIFVMVD